MMLCTLVVPKDFIGKKYFTLKSVRPVRPKLPHVTVKRQCLEKAYSKYSAVKIEIPENFC